MKRIGIYGGTFDPPHVGHVRAAQHALCALKLDELLVIPAGTSPGKDGQAPKVTAEQRLELTRIAMGEIPGVTVLDTELRRGGVSYTADTLDALKRLYPDAEFALLLGADKFLSFTDWYRSDEILQNASLAVFSRGKYPKNEELQTQKEKVEAVGGKVTLLQNPVTEISSTDVRRLLVFGCAEEFVPPRVLAYILGNGLYDTDVQLRQMPMDQLEKTVISLLKPSRVAHVLGCRDTAVELAKRWGADETDAARAGLLHDITKALDGPLQLTLCRCCGTVLDDFSLKYPKTLHALTGSLVAKYMFGENDAVVDAIASHTTGKGNMNTLEEIIYVADYMEPNRDFPGVEELRTAAFTDLHKAMKMGLEMTIAMLQKQGNEVSPGSQEALNWLSAL